MSQNREELEARMAAFIDGELPPDEAARLEVFLANTDSALADKVIAMLGDKHSIRQLPRMPAPPDLSARIMDAVERTSLLHEVDTFDAPKRPWWQSKSAIAAGLLILLSGFTYVVIQSTVRNENGFHEFVAGRVARSPEPLVDKQNKLATADVSDGLATARRDEVRAVAKSTGDDAEAAQSLAILESKLAMSARNIDEEVMRSQAAVQVPPEIALKNGFVPASTPQTALEKVKASPTQFISGTPVLVTLVARDDADPQRLHSMLQEMLRQDVAASNQQFALNDRLATYGNNYAAGTSRAVQGKSAKDANFNSNYDYNVYDASNRQFLRQNAGGSLANSAPMDNDKEPNGARGEQQAASEQKIASAETPGKGGNSEVQAKPSAQPEPRPSKATGQVQNYAQRAETAANMSVGNEGGNSVGNALSPNQAAGTAGNALSFSSNPYRIVLRADQLARITETFQVNTITRGRDAYLINNANTDRLAGGGWANLPASRAGKYSDDAKNSIKTYEKSPDASKADGNKAEATLPSSNGPASPIAVAPANPAPSPAPGEATRSKESAPGGEAGGNDSVSSASKTLAEGTTTAQREDIYKDGKKSQDAAATTPAAQWVEVIITMESLPASLQFRADQRGSTLQQNDRSQRSSEQQIHQGK